MNEITAIEKMRSLFAVSGVQRFAPFTCDAEILELGRELYGISVDEFSPDEDCFSDADPAALGKGLAVATLSDLLAAGCEPCFYLHALVEPVGKDGFGLELSRGGATILQAAGCFFLGGDLGRGNDWRYTGVALGKCGASPSSSSGIFGVSDPSGTLGESGPISRLLPQKRQKLWLTGTLGDGNLRAVSKEAAPPFELRIAEARAMRGLASACIDTSGGLMDSLCMLRKVNPGFSFNVVPERLPYDPAVRAFAGTHGLPLAAFAFGGAGEYELLFATDEDVSVEWAMPIGHAVPDGKGDLFWGRHRLEKDLPDPRVFADKKQYIQHLLEYINVCPA